MRTILSSRGREKESSELFYWLEQLVARRRLGNCRGDRVGMTVAFEEMSARVNTARVKGRNKKVPRR